MTIADKKKIGDLKVKTSRLVKMSPVAWDHSLDPVDRVQMWGLGAWSDDNNQTWRHEPTEEEILMARHILEKYFGRITAVSIWYSKPIESWRVCFGN